jgi:hypothetical protein
MQKMNGATGERTTLVEEETHLKGSLSSNCPIVVRGKVEGDLTAPLLSVSATGAVHGMVKVDEIVSEGELSGEFEADIVRLSGVVKDKTVVRAKSLEVKLAPPNTRMEIQFGECALEIGEAPDKEAVLGAALAANRPAARSSTMEPPPAQEHRSRKRTSTLPPGAP